MMHPRWMKLHGYLTLIYPPWEAPIRFSEALSSQKGTRYSEELSSLGLSAGQPLLIADYQQYKNFALQKEKNQKPTKRSPPQTGSFAWRRSARTSAEAPAAHLGTQAQTLWCDRRMGQQLPLPSLFPDPSSTQDNMCLLKFPPLAFQ